MFDTMTMSLCTDRINRCAFRIRGSRVVQIIRGFQLYTALTFALLLSVILHLAVKEKID